MQPNMHDCGLFAMHHMRCVVECFRGELSARDAFYKLDKMLRLPPLPRHAVLWEMLSMDLLDFSTLPNELDKSLQSRFLGGHRQLENQDLLGAGRGMPWARGCLQLHNLAGQAPP